jgi:hypothetical protein
MSNTRSGNLTDQTYEGVDANKYATDSKKFNTEFDTVMAKYDAEIKAKEDAQLGVLNSELDEIETKGLTDLTIGELMQDGTQQIFNMVSGQKEDGGIFAQRRLFYLGILCISVALMIWLVNSLLE